MLAFGITRPHQKFSDGHPIIHVDRGSGDDSDNEGEQRGGIHANGSVYAVTMGGV